MIYLKLLILFLLLILLACLLFNKNNESFKSKPHNCYQDSTILRPESSHKSLLKGWCTTIQPYSYSDIFNFNLDDVEEDELINESSKCGQDYSRIKPHHSVRLKSKSWCAVPE